MARNLRLRWAHKILKAKSFVILTDKESIIALSGVEPENINDIVMLQEQSSSVENFLYNLQDLQQRHEQRIRELMGGSDETAKTESAPAKRPKVKSIEVKEEQS